MEEQILTQAQLEAVTTQVYNMIRARGGDVGEIEIVSSLAGLTSLPVIRDAGGLRKVVRVSLSVFGEMLLSVSAPTLQKLDAAVAAAEAAAAEIAAVIDRADGSADRVETALATLQALIDESRASSARAEAGAELAGDKAAFAQEQGDHAAASADRAEAKIAETETARQGTLVATAEAVEVAEHPTMVGLDHYVYVWNRDTKAYDKTAIFVKGDPFRIDKTYPSRQAMEVDVANPLVPVGAFVLINAEDVEQSDNATVWLKREADFAFVVDMSGAQGFTGKTPQLFVGQFTTGAAGSAGGASLSDGGVDEEGNPRVILNITLPRGEQGKPAIVLPNGNFGNYNEATGAYDDSGVQASAKADLQNTPVDFAEAVARENIASGETMPTMLGKIRKWFAALGTLAFKDKVDYATEVTGALKLAASTELPAAPGTPSAGTAASAARTDHVHGPDATKQDADPALERAVYNGAEIDFANTFTPITAGEQVTFIGAGLSAAILQQARQADNVWRPLSEDWIVVSEGSGQVVMQLSGAQNRNVRFRAVGGKQDAFPNGTDPLIGEDGKIEPSYLTNTGGRALEFIQNTEFVSSWAHTFNTNGGQFVVQLSEFQGIRRLVINNTTNAPIFCLVQGWESFAVNIEPNSQANLVVSTRLFFRIICADFILEFSSAFGTTPSPQNFVQWIKY